MTEEYLTEHCCRSKVLLQDGPKKRLSGMLLRHRKDGKLRRQLQCRALCWCSQEDVLISPSMCRVLQLFPCTWQHTSTWTPQKLAKPFSDLQDAWDQQSCPKTQLPSQHDHEMWLDMLHSWQGCSSYHEGSVCNRAKNGAGSHCVC